MRTDNLKYILCEDKKQLLYEIILNGTIKSEDVIWIDIGYGAVSRLSEYQIDEVIIAISKKDIVWLIEERIR